MEQQFSLLIWSDQFLRSHDVSITSKVTYKNSLRQFARWYKNKDILEPDRENILEYKNWLDQTSLSSFTKATYMVVLRRFFAWLEHQGLYKDVARGIKSARRFTKSHKKDSLSVDVVKKLLASISQATLRGARDFAIINLLIRSGLRLKEISGAKIEDVHVETTSSSLWICGKGRGGKDEFIVLTAQSLDPIKNYLRRRKPKKAREPLFASLSNCNFNEKISTFALSKMVKKYLRKAGIDSKRISAHSLRHTFGVLAIKAGASLYEVQLAMRHASPATTEVYLGDIEKIKRLEASPERKLTKLLEE